jgi:hypothetical protein
MNMDEAGKYGIADGIQSLKVVRQHAAEWGVSPDRVGFMGFSAGAMVTSGTLLQPDAAARPDFAAMIYGGPFGAMPAIPAKLPPMFLAWAQDDAVALAPIVKFYSALASAGHKPEVHIFNSGGHGFGMRRQGTTSDHWIDAFYYWLEAQGLNRRTGSTVHRTARRSDVRISTSRPYSDNFIVFSQPNERKMFCRARECKVIQKSEGGLSTMRYSTLILNVVILGTALGCVRAQAQEKVSKPVSPVTVQQPPNPNVMRVRGFVSTAQSPRQQIQIQEKPAPLTATEKSALTGLTITNLTASAPFTLTLAAPFVPNRGSLLLDNPMIVNPQNNPSVAIFKSQDSFFDAASLAYSNRALTVTIDHLKAGKHYLIDCAVKGGETYYVRVFPGDLKQTFSNTNHVVILYEAGTDYGEFTITAKTPNHWFFYSAEVTPLD